MSNLKFKSWMDSNGSIVQNCKTFVPIGFDHMWLNWLIFYTVNQNGISELETFLHEILLEDMICAYHLDFLPPVDLYLISEKSIWKNQARQTGFLVFFELDFYCLYSQQKSISKLIFAG